MLWYLPARFLLELLRGEHGTRWRVVHGGEVLTVTDRLEQRLLPRVQARSRVGSIQNNHKRTTPLQRDKAPLTQRMTRRPCIMNIQDPRWPSAYCARNFMTKLHSLCQHRIARHRWAHEFEKTVQEKERELQRRISDALQKM